MAVSFPDLGKCKPKGPSYGVWYGFLTPYGSPPNRLIYGVRKKQMASGWFVTGRGYVGISMSLRAD